MQAKAESPDPKYLLDSQSQRAATFLQDELLSTVIRDSRYYLPDPACSIVRSPIVQAARQISLRVEIEHTAKNVAGTRVRDGIIKLSDGYFCERWCATYFLLKSALTQKMVPEAPLLTLLPKGAAFSWPVDTPQPAEIAMEFVEPTNKIYPSVVTATLLHEIGHNLVEKVTVPGPVREAMCDRFAERYLLGKRRGDGTDFRRLGVAIWLCCICSESLSESGYYSSTHPHPVDRVLTFLKAHASHPPKSELDSIVHLICAAHIMKLARVSRPSHTDTVLENKHRNLRHLLRDLKDCW
jgi:hypothetical protein